MLVKTRKTNKRKVRIPLRYYEIAKTDDHTFDKSISKANRRIVVTYKNGEYIYVNKITSIKGKEEKVRKGIIVPLIGCYGCLSVPSAI